MPFDDWVKNPDILVRTLLKPQLIDRYKNHIQSAYFTIARSYIEKESSYLTFITTKTILNNMDSSSEYIINK